MAAEIYCCVLDAYSIQEFEAWREFMASLVTKFCLLIQVCKNISFEAPISRDYLESSISLRLCYEIIIRLEFRGMFLESSKMWDFRAILPCFL